MRSSSWWYNWKCCLVVTQSPGLPLLDEYQTTEPARMCREQSEQGLRNTLRMVVHKLWWICQFEQVCWCFMPSPYCRVLSLSSQTTSHYEHHPSFYTQHIEVNNSFAGLLIATVVDSFTLHSLDTFVVFLFLWKVCVEWRITNYFGGICSKALVCRGVLFLIIHDHKHMILYSLQCTETECVTVLLQLHIE